MQNNILLQNSRLGRAQQIRKQKLISFVFPHVTLGKSLETIVWSRGVRDENRVSSVLGKSLPTVAHVTAKTRPPRWSTTFNNILLSEGDETWHKKKILRDERSIKWELA